MRCDGWESKLVEFLEREGQTPFAWGERDCVLFASDAAVLLTGKDPAAEGRGKYRTKEEGFAVLRAIGCSQPGLMDAHFQRIRPSEAQRGDIVYRKREGGASFGVVYGGAAFYRSPETGLVKEPVALADAAWRVE